MSEESSEQLVARCSGGGDVGWANPGSSHSSRVTSHVWQARLVNMARRQWAIALTALAATAIAAAAVASLGSDEPSNDVSTKLVGEPAVFRLTGYEGTVTNTNARYVVIFKLNRDPVIKIDPDREGPDEDRGDFGVAGYGLGFYGQAESFGGRKHCFAGVVETAGDEDPGPQVARLDRVSLGGRIEVTLQPLTPSPATGRLVPGRLYVRHPRIQSGDHRLSHGQVSERDQPKLSAMGCD